MASEAQAADAPASASVPAGAAAAKPRADEAASARLAAFLALLWRRYLAQLSARPLRTKCLTAGGVAAASDVIAQGLTAPRLQLPRVLKFALFGALWSGPALHYCACAPRGCCVRRNACFARN